MMVSVAGGDADPGSLRSFSIAVTAGRRRTETENCCSTRRATTRCANSGLRPTDFTGEIVGIADGDTLTVLHGDQQVRIRFPGIDAPKKTRPFGTVARQYADELAFGQTGTVRVQDYDRYGRTVAEIILPDGRSLNEEMVKAGLAWWYRQ